MPAELLKRHTGGAVGAGLVLVVLPCLSLALGMGLIHRHPTVGLPILAIFGIMILFGAMALTSTLFARLGLANRNEALALPEGSIRAAIALALIVLFAIIAIMLFQSLAEPYRISGLSEEDKTAIIKEPKNRVLAVRTVECPAPAASAARPCFEVHLVQTAGQEATDIAKQLLILIGTLMTSVTSYYFASRSAAASRPAPDETDQPAPGAPQAPASTLVGAAPAGHTHRGTAEPDTHDGCDVAITNPTDDKDLPPATGGVAQ
jgi:TRAP-type C4-dicarboxylate transport system permease small subunit